MDWHEQSGYLIFYFTIKDRASRFFLPLPNPWNTCTSQFVGNLSNECVRAADSLAREQIHIAYHMHPSNIKLDLYRFVVDLYEMTLITRLRMLVLLWFVFHALQLLPIKFT